MQTLLVIFGWLAVITSILIVFVPYFRGRTPLISWWSLYQIGCANFIGLASVQSGNAYTHAYCSPRDQDYLSFVIGGTVFYVVSILTYYGFGWPQRLGERTFAKWGKRSPHVLLIMSILGLVAVLGYAYVPNIQFLGQMLVQFGRIGGVYALAFCLVAWAQRPYNMWLGGVAFIVFAIAAIAGNLDFGRRDFLSVMLTIPICWYWLRARSYNVARVIGILGVFACLAVVALMGVSMVRGVRVDSGAGVFQTAYAKIRAIPGAIGSQTSADSMLGGDTTEASLATIQLYDGTLPIEPFYTFKFVLANPIPRVWWPEESKPKGLGYTLSFDIGYYRSHGPVNLGPGIVGHGYQEGGAIMVALYAFLYAAALRFFDSMLQRDPSNPYVLGLFGSVSGQLVAFVRGDCALFAVLVLGAVFTGWLLNLISRSFFGTERYLPAPAPGFEPIAEAEYTYEQQQPMEWNQF